MIAPRPQCGRGRGSTRENTGLDGATETQVIDCLGSSFEVLGLAKYPSHGGSQGFKSPHLHPHNSPGHRPGGLLSPGRCRSRVAGRAANGQQPRTKRPRCLIAGHDDVVKRGQDSRPSDCESVPTLPPGPAPDHPGCSGTGPIPSSAVLRCLVLAPGLPERLPLSCVAPVNLP
jgi:hypothetical protein